MLLISCFNSVPQEESVCEIYFTGPALWDTSYSNSDFVEQAYSTGPTPNFMKVAPITSTRLSTSMREMARFEQESPSTALRRSSGQGSGQAGGAEEQGGGQ